MAKAFSADLRQRVITASAAGHKNVAIARFLDVSEAWVHKVLRHYHDTGEIEPTRGKPGPQPKLAGEYERIRAAVAEQPDATLAELRDALGVEVDLSTLWRALDQLQITFKKSPARGRTKSA